MAFDTKDAYELISDGLYAGAVAEDITDEERFTRAISHGFLENLAEIEPYDGDQSGGLNDLGTGIRL